MASGHFREAGDSLGGLRWREVVLATCVQLQLMVLVHKGADMTF